LLALALLALPLAGGCSRIDTLRLAHANSGTSADWPPGAVAVELALERTLDGRPWLPVSVDGSAPLPFLLQGSAGAIALTGARPAGLASGFAGRMTLSQALLPGIQGGRLVKRRRLELGPLALEDQGLLLVEPAEWPHGRPRGFAAGVIGYDLFRRFVVEIELPADRLRLHRGSRGLLGLGEAQRLLVLDRRLYVEAWLEFGRGLGRWVRLEFEPAAPVGICLDTPSRPATVRIADFSFPVDETSCDDRAPGARGSAARDGVLGAQALESLAVGVDYRGGQIAFRRVD